MAEEGIVIAVTGDKGGVGKSTLTALFTEWLRYKGYTVKVIDSDPNQSTQVWIDKCADLGQAISSPDADITIVDTAGTTGSSFTKYIRDADIILVPFQPHDADLEVIVGWFLSVKESVQERVLFIPNRLTRTNVQQEGMGDLIDAIKEEGKGKILSGLVNRPAVYPKVLKGAALNFFNNRLDKKTREETEHLFTQVINALED